MHKLFSLEKERTYNLKILETVSNIKTCNTIMRIKKIRSEYIGAHKFLEKSSKNIIDKKATFTILIFLSLRNGLFVHRSEQRQFLEQLV